MKGPGSPAWRKAGRPATMPTKPKPTPQEIVADLAGLTPEQQVKAAAPEAIEMIISIMRNPGRNAQAQLAAARELMAYSVQKPVTKNEHEHKGGLNVTISTVSVD